MIGTDFTERYNMGLKLKNTKEPREMGSGSEGSPLPDYYQWVGHQLQWRGINSKGNPLIKAHFFILEFVHLTFTEEQSQKYLRQGSDFANMSC